MACDFFERAHHRIHVDFEHTGGIADDTAVEGHVNDLPFDARLVSLVGIDELKSDRRRGYAYRLHICSRFSRWPLSGAVDGRSY